jgi:hypothetical protein
LKGTLGDLVHPGRRFLEGIDFTMQMTSTHMRLDRYVQYLLEHPSCSANKIGVRYPKKSRCLSVRGDDVVCRRTGIHVVN